MCELFHLLFNSNFPQHEVLKMRVNMLHLGAAYKVKIDISNNKSNSNSHDIFRIIIIYVKHLSKFTFIV